MRTKNFIMLFLALVLISTTTYAQTNFGLRTGVAVTTFANKGDLTDNSNVTVSCIAGGFLDIPISKSLFIQPEINYLRKGRSNETAELNTTVKTDYMVHYLQVPVLLQYRDVNLLKNSGSSFYVNAGPYAAFGLNSQTRPSNSLLATDSSKADWGATVGIGFQTPMCSKNVRFDLRYDIGMSEIANQPVDYRTKGLSLTVGIAL